MAIKEKIKVIITDDSPVFLEGLKLLLSESTEFEIIDTCNNGLELLTSSKLGCADLVLTDIEMPVLDGMEAGKKINFEFPHLPMVALTMHQEKVYLLDLISAGFKGFIHKPEIPVKLLEVIESVLSNNFMFPENLKIN